MMRRSLLAVCALAACTQGRVSETLLATPLPAMTLETSLALSAAPSFGDERGGGVFVDLSGRVVRLRANGQQGVIDPHPQDPLFPGPASAVWPLGPYTGLAATSRGLFVADNGWLITPPWQTTLDPEGLVATTVAEGGIGWVAHHNGLYRLENGGLSQLTVDGAPINGLTALAAGPAPDARQGVWFAQGATLSSAAQSSTASFIVRDSGLTATDLSGGVSAMASIAPSSTSGGEVWAITPHSLFQFTILGWRKYDMGRVPRQLMAAGRFAWLQAGNGLFRYDADAAKWFEATGLPAVPTLVAVDASGAAWVRVGDKTLEVRLEASPRVHGLFQNATVYDPENQLEISLASERVPSALSFAFDQADATVLKLTDGFAGSGPQSGLMLWSLGGIDASGKVKPLSLAALADGPHALRVTAEFADGSQAVRTVYFDYAGGATGQVSWSEAVRPISEGRCAKCHTTGTMPNLATLAEWQANAAVISAAVKDKRMPADGPLDPAAIQLIARWANGGALP